MIIYNMKIRYISDLHLEFIKPNKIVFFIKKIIPDNDAILILAGDVGNPFQTNYHTFMNYVENNFERTYIIPGNHEYYGKTIDETNNFLKEYFTQFKNIKFLNNSYENYKDHCFIGTTLWSKITDPEYEINDIYKIVFFNNKKYNNLHKESVQFLEEVVPINNNCIIITHHVPSESLTDIKYKTKSMLPYNQWFHCNMDNFINLNKDKIKCWFYGHTHTASNVNINGIPFLCNPIGYPGENPKPDYNAVFDVFSDKQK